MKSLQDKKFIGLCCLSIFIIMVFNYSLAAAPVNTYPIKGWQISTPEKQGMQSHKLVEMMEHIKNSSLNIDSILIVRHGYLALDAYFYPFSIEQKHRIYSCTKSIMSALIGIAIDRGYLQNVDQPIMDFFPDKAFANMNDHKKSIRLENCLTMTSGLQCRDSYLYRWTGLFEMRNSNDWAQHVLDLPMAEAPGTRFEYCNGVSHLLSVIIQKTTKMKTADFARKHLFEPLGIIDVEWERDPQDIDIGYCCMWLKPHDLAKIGWLYLNKGRWADKQILPSAWVEDSTRGHIDATIFDHYGYQWWVDAAGYYAAVGKGGQRIYVVPEKNLVMVFTGDIRGRDAMISKSLLDDYIIPAAASPDPLPANPEEQARLDALLKSVARVKAFTWTSEGEGIAKDGVFRRTALPAFKLEYPIGSRKTAIRFPGQVMRMKTPGDVLFAASVIDIPENMQLEDFGPKHFVRELEPLASNIKVISNKKITLKCGTKAYRTDIDYLWENYFPVKTLLVSAYKDGKCIFVHANPYKNHYKAEPIVQSLTFK